MQKQDAQALSWMKQYLRFTDYLGAAQLYLRDNFFLEEELRPEHCKSRILGHWGTVPGLNLVYANLNYLVYKHKINMLLVTGPGHGAPAILANLYAEKTLDAFYKNYPLNRKGFGQIVSDFSWPYSPFPSHVTPTVPGSILEGGELGYSLATAFGSVLDNPDLITAVVVGDGEAETGPTATAWHSNKFINPKTSGAVLPIVHINGYKISNPTIYGTMSDAELTSLFKGYGYNPHIIKGPNVEEKTIAVMEKSYQEIREIQKKARSQKTLNFQPKWPVILLQTPKGWKGLDKFHGHKVEGSFHSHGIPVDHPKDDPEALKAIKGWLESYKVHELIDQKGTPKNEVLQFVPSGKYRIGMNKHAIGGNFYKKLKLPSLSKHGIKFKKRGATLASSMGQGALMLRDIFKMNEKTFRLMCPDEIESNKLGAIFQATKRAYMWPLKNTDEDLSTEGRAMEMLSEHTLQGWLQGYILTGRHAMFVTYEAFAPIIASMVDQHAKFLKQSFNVKWRKPVASAIYVLSSLGWRQDHNGYSHQNPSFISGVLQKHGKFSQIYFPSDANSLLVAFEETFKKPDSISVIVAGKRDLPQWQTIDEAREQAKTGLRVWDWVGGKGSKNPDVVMASAGDYITQEAVFAVKMCRDLVPELNIRYVNVSELTSLGLGDYCQGNSCLTKVGFNQFFTDKKPVVFGYHGYVNDLEQVLWPHADSDRFTLRGYNEEGSTTTPFDIKMRNGVSCYHFAIALIEQGSKSNAKVRRKKDKIIAEINARIVHHQEYIREFGDDPEEVKNMKW
ncbi:phosphoketolase [Candidatus Peregrinibacteria bacterium CG10_big_fil_rev_8_21_14_0_10_36_19]|nr:MAG: phosphoketolase [Candidatus Peregrinibacteria bacterium CG10_big_fil_rev_8_21_14_0_10_36_19]